MHLLSLALALAADPAATLQDSLVSCAADQLQPLVAPTGVEAPWPVVESLPEHLAGGVLLSDQGVVADGYSHTLHVDPSTRTAYVVQVGGIAGYQTVYGPLPVPVCAGLPSNNSFKGTPLHGTP